MWLFIVKWYRELIIAGLGVVCILFYFSNNILKAEKQTLNAELVTEQTKVATQNALIEANKAEYETKLTQLPKQVLKVETKYQTVFSTVTKWRDSNATDCNSSMLYLDQFTY